MTLSHTDKKSWATKQLITECHSSYKASLSWQKIYINKCFCLWKATYSKETEVLLVCMKNIQIFSVCSHMYSWHVVHNWKDIQNKTGFHFSLDNRDCVPTRLLQFRSGAISSSIHPNIQAVILSLNSTFAIFLSISFELLYTPRECLRHRQNWNTSIEYRNMSIFCSRGRSTSRTQKKIKNSIASYSPRFSLKILKILKIFAGIIHTSTVTNGPQHLHQQPPTHSAPVKHRSWGLLFLASATL